MKREIMTVIQPAVRDTQQLQQIRECRVGLTVKCGKNQLAGTYSSKKEGVRRKDVIGA
jgi:hypothetical protein